MTNELQQLKEFCEQSISQTKNTHTLIAFERVIEKINSLSQPETRLFEFPIPEGWRAKTKCGKEVTQLVEFKEAKPFQIAGVVEGEIMTWKADGVYSMINTGSLDLILVREEPKTKTVWVVKEQLMGNYVTGYWYDSIDRANDDGWKEPDLIPVNVPL
jgi:hypothetical protein